MKPLTSKQETVLKYIQHFQDEFNMTPSLTQIAIRFNFTKTSARWHVNQLVKKKKLKQNNKEYRKFLIVS